MPSCCPEAPDKSKPLVVSLCGTFLKPEMQSIYRQVTGFQRVRTIVYTQSHENADLFPFEPVKVLKKLPRPRPRGNFVKRFWYKHVLKVWPPPRPIERHVHPYYPYDLVSRLRKNAPELVHVYYGHKAVHYYEMLRAWGGPFVVSFHGVDVSKFLDRPAYVATLKKVFANARLVMARSQSLLDRLVVLGCPKDKLRLNRTPIPLDHLTAVPRTAPADGEWRLVQACRLIPKKGIITALKALKIVTTTHPNIKYIICGVGPLSGKIQRTAAELELTSHIELRGWMSQEQLVEAYNRAHIFLHPSETTKDADQEGIPNSMLEAMATGLPVVATQHGGIPEAVTHGFDGLLVPERSPELLAEAMLTLLNSPAQLTAMSANAAASVRENFGSTAQVAAMEDVYFEAISRK